MPLHPLRPVSPRLILSSLAFLLTTSVSFAQEGMPPSEVGILPVQTESLSILSELPGRVSATRIADVRPRVGGIIETREFEQGGMVSEGDVLFRLDRATYEIAVEAAAANVARTEAVLVDAQATERRLASLNESNITSRAQYETAQAARLQAEAALAEARAQLRAAEINLGYTEVKAPISGRIGRAQVTEGALVGAQGEVLTTIQQLDPVYADMQQPVSELLRLRQALDSGALTMVEPGAAKVILILDNGTEYPHPGKLLFAEAAVERSSGQVTLRAEFPNPDGILLPGMYIRVIVEQATEADAVAIPSQAIQRGADGGAEVYLFAADGTAQLHPVELGRSVGNRVTVESGLSAGDLLIVDGFQKMGPGAPVAPVCWSDPSGNTPDRTDVCATALALAAAN